MKRFATIVADPPWDYGAHDAGRWPSGPGGDRITRTPMPYKAMSASEIGDLPVGELAAEDCRLFLWTTNKHLPDSFAVLAAWGFEYRQTLIWRKTGNPSPFGGSVAPIHAEFLLVGVRGRPERLERLSSSVLEIPKPRDHSVKPEAFIDYIELISPPPRLELFARRARFGWDYWGDESHQTVELPEPETVGGGALS